MPLRPNRKPARPQDLPVHTNPVNMDFEKRRLVIPAVSGFAPTGLVAKTLFNADTFLYAVVDNTPVATSPANVLAALTGHAAAAFDWNSQNLTGVGTLNTHTIPAGTDTFCLLAATQELDNKTLDSAVAKGT